MIFDRRIESTVMDDEWIKRHVRHCLREHGIDNEIIMAKMEELSSRETEYNLFEGEIGKLIEESEDPKVSQTRKCVQDAIIFTIVDTDGSEPEVPNCYAPLASVAIAKHLWLAYRRL